MPHGVRCYGSEDAELIWVHDGVEPKGSSVYLHGPGPFPQDDDITLIRYNGLEPDWSLPRAKEPEFMRWRTTYVGGNTGFENYNPDLSVTNDNIYIGLHTLLPAQKDVPYETDQGEIRVVLDGKVVISEGSMKGTELQHLDSAFFHSGQSVSLRNHGKASARMLVVTEAPRCLANIRYQTD